MRRFNIWIAMAVTVSDRHSPWEQTHKNFFTCEDFELKFKLFSYRFLDNKRREAENWRKKKNL